MCFLEPVTAVGNWSLILLRNCRGQDSICASELSSSTSVKEPGHLHTISHEGFWEGCTHYSQALLSYCVEYTEKACRQRYYA